MWIYKLFGCTRIGYWSSRLHSNENFIIGWKP